MEEQINITVPVIGDALALLGATMFLNCTYIAMLLKLQQGKEIDPSEIAKQVSNDVLEFWKLYGTLLQKVAHAGHDSTNPQTSG